MGNDVQERIRHRAYEIWESEGRPEYQHLRHWGQASKELGEGCEDEDRERIDRDDRDEAALLQGAGENGDFDGKDIKSQSSGTPSEVAITTGQQSVHQAVKKTEGP
jgi:hypothetical protein